MSFGHPSRAEKLLRECLAVVQRLKRIPISLTFSLSAETGETIETLIVIDPVEHMTVGKRADDWVESVFAKTGDTGRVLDVNRNAGTDLDADLKDAGQLFEMLARTDQRVARSLIARSVSIAPELFTIENEPVDKDVRRRLRAGTARPVLEDIAKAWIVFRKRRSGEKQP